MCSGAIERYPQIGNCVSSVLLGVFLLLLAAACESKPVHAPPPPEKVTVSQPVRQMVTDSLELTGNTQAINTVQLQARVEGYLGEVFFRDGGARLHSQSNDLVCPDSGDRHRFVDDAIIIVENSAYYIERGVPPKEATIRAMRELTGPVMGIALALVSVFLPAAFLPGITGQIFRQFALVIAATAVISAINALTLKPVQCAFWLRPRGGKAPSWFYRAFNRAFQAMTNAYMGVVVRMVKRPVLMLIVFAVIIGASFWGFAQRATGFLPTEDQGIRRSAGTAA